MQKLVFVSSLPVSRIFGEKVHARWFAENGFEVQFWDISPLFYSGERLEQYFGGAATYRYEGPNHRIFRARQDVEQAVEDLVTTDRVLYLSRFFKTTDDDWIFAKLHDKKIRYYFQHFDTNIEPSRLSIKVRRLITEHKQRFLNRYLKPHAVIGSGRMGRRQACAIFRSAKFISIPSVKVLWETTGPVIEGGYSVFVDENIDYAPDAKLLGHSVCIDPDAYYARLNHFLDQIEKWSGLPVVVAASGKYQYPRDRFSGRQLVYGKTLSLIQRAELVVGHVSLALDQCLVSEKPVLILDDPAFSPYKRSGFASSLLNFVTKPVMVTSVTRSIFDRALQPETATMRRIVLDYLREEEVDSGFVDIMKSEFQRA
ncbi:MAG: hypothetical protein M0T84_10365 [Betaproteobacteria bacterium]|nr:hypothetical protein [Betaproteobacteria bacterium]